MNPKRAWETLLDLVEGEDAPGETLYDPVQIAGVVMGCFAALGALYWLLWALLVCEGGLFVKIVPLLRVLFTSRTLRDFGYEGYPYQLGVFEGWLVNLIALLLAVLGAAALWRLVHTTDKGKTP